MLKNYKKSYIVINSILIILLFFLLFNFLYLKKTSYLFYLLCLLIPFGIIFLIYGYERKKRRFMYELIFYIFAYGILFTILTYIVGIFIGFNHSVYKFGINNIIHNIIPYILLIIVGELFRYEIVRKGSGSKLSYILITLILIMVDMSLFLTTYDLTNGDSQIKYICGIVLPSIFKNIILMYFSKIGGPIPTIIYRFIFDLKVVLLPIFPNFGLYIESIINCIFPVSIFALIELTIRKDEKVHNENIDVRKKFLYRYLVIFILFLVVLSVNFLASGNFKYTLISIGSGSMVPTISKGDAVIYKKVDMNNMPNVGDILVFKKDKKVVVHRIIDVVQVDPKTKIYYTKGDANESPDGYPIEYKDILGKVLFKIKYIGIPSVLIGEAISK